MWRVYFNGRLLDAKSYEVKELGDRRVEIAVPRIEVAASAVDYDARVIRLRGLKRSGLDLMAESILTLGSD